MGSPLGPHQAETEHFVGSATLPSREVSCGRGPDHKDLTLIPLSLKHPREQGTAEVQVSEEHIRSQEEIYPRAAFNDA